MITTLTKAVKLIQRNPLLFIRLLFSKVYNAVFSPQRTLTNHNLTQSRVINEIIQRAHRQRTDISDHLITLFVEGTQTKPRLIVELGVRGGESTYVFERVSQLTGAKLVSVDIEDCSSSSTYENWMFVQMDDIAFAQQFESWCVQRQIIPEIDLLFIDTSHKFDHTVQELQYWLPFTSSQAKVILHDTNMRHIYRRADGSLGVTQHQHRGVIAALEQYFNKSFNERLSFLDYQQGWLIKHVSHSSGLTILEKITPPLA